MDKFWMVIKKDGFGSENTSFRHESLDSARAEAWRLSQMHKAQFVILEATEVMLEPWATQLRPMNTGIARTVRAEGIGLNAAAKQDLDDEHPY
ncbi:hypothetical protein [Labrenzia sp. DG1229]|uniref:hypothetical protein n=1 Tax=Labrenzia sp. DG1229 TaxID=681847 RepID=UPI00048BE007|nr:hypothetical protein [Labrenzia sp. DG1229]